MADKSDLETTVRRQRHYGRLHFDYRWSLWRERVAQWLIPLLWAFMPIIAILALMWSGDRGQ